MERTFGIVAAVAIFVFGVTLPLAGMLDEAAGIATSTASASISDPTLAAPKGDLLAPAKADGMITIVHPGKEPQLTIAFKGLPHAPITASMEPSAADMAAYEHMLDLGQADTGKPDHQ